MNNLDSILKSRDVTLLTKVLIVKAMVFPVVMYGCESWTIKKVECRRIDAFELWCWRRLQSPLDCKDIKWINPKGDQPWIFIERTDAEAETPVLWPADVKSWLTGKDPDAGQVWRQQKGMMIGDEMVGWHHGLNGHELVQAPGDGEGQGSLVCCSPWSQKESDTTELLNSYIYKSESRKFRWIHRSFTYSTWWLLKGVSYPAVMYMKAVIYVLYTLMWS